MVSISKLTSLLMVESESVSSDLLNTSSFVYRAPVFVSFRFGQPHVESVDSGTSPLIGQLITAIVFWPIKTSRPNFLNSHFRFIFSCIVPYQQIVNSLAFSVRNYK